MKSRVQTIRSNKLQITDKSNKKQPNEERKKEEVVAKIKAVHNCQLVSAYSNITRKCWETKYMIKFKMKWENEYKVHKYKFIYWQSEQKIIINERSTQMWKFFWFCGSLRTAAVTETELQYQIPKMNKQTEKRKYLFQNEKQKKQNIKYTEYVLRCNKWIWCVCVCVCLTPTASI